MVLRIEDTDVERSQARFEDRLNYVEHIPLELRDAQLTSDRRRPVTVFRG